MCDYIWRDGVFVSNTDCKQGLNTRSIKTLAELYSCDEKLFAMNRNFQFSISLHHSMSKFPFILKDVFLSNLFKVLARFNIFLKERWIFIWIKNSFWWDMERGNRKSRYDSIEYLLWFLQHKQIEKTYVISQNWIMFHIKGARETEKSIPTVKRLRSKKNALDVHRANQAVLLYFSCVKINNIGIGT